MEHHKNLFENSQCSAKHL